jgi:hypothetical protein
MKKAELVKIWKQIDRATEGIEKLEQDGLHDDDGQLFSALCNLKERLETEIDKKSRTSNFEGA